MGSGVRKTLQLRQDAKILVRAPNWIGDVVIGTASLSVLRQSFPRARISVLAKPWVIPVLKHNPHIDEIVQYDAAGLHKGVKGILRLSRHLRRQRFDAAILFQRAFEAAVIAKLARIPVRMGYGTDGRGFLLTHRLRAAKEEFLVPRVQHDLRLLEEFGMRGDRRELFLGIGVDQIQRAQELLRRLGIEAGDRFYALSPGSVGGVCKRWAPERFAALAARISGTYGTRGVLLGASHEQELGEEILCLASVPGLANLAGRTSLEEAIALTALSGLFVTNDSGLMHVAAALGVPLAAIFGPTDPRKTAPWSGRAVVVRNEEADCAGCKPEACGKDYICMSGITVDQVFRAVQGLVDRHGFDTAGARAESVHASEKAVPVVTAAEQETLRPAGGLREAPWTKRPTD